jgi:diguanylate cyclase (GGDEF)-like protein
MDCMDSRASWRAGTVAFDDEIAAGPTSGTRILVVDDSTELRGQLEVLLRVAGLGDVVQAGSASEAFVRLGLDHASEIHPDIDLIVMDADMPGMNGIRACRHIHHRRELRDIPIVIVSAHDDASLLEAAFHEGAIDYIIKPVRGGELIARVDAALQRKLERDRERRERVQLEHRVVHDTLTGVSRRGSFLQRLDAEWRRAARHGVALSFVMIDVDEFHAYNEAYGHPAGDGCLRVVSATLKTGLGRPTDVLCRYGGEEFAALLPETSLAGALTVAENLRTRIETLAIPHRGSSCARVVTASFGVASGIPVTGRPVLSIVAAADEALYRAKAAGRNRVLAADAPAPTLGDHR